MDPHQALLSMGILQARLLEWVAMLFSRGSSRPRNQTASPALQVDSLPAELPGSPFNLLSKHKNMSKFMGHSLREFIALLILEME